MRAARVTKSYLFSTLMYDTDASRSQQRSAESLAPEEVGCIAPTGVSA